MAYIRGEMHKVPQGYAERGVYMKRNPWLNLLVCMLCVLCLQVDAQAAGAWDESEYARDWRTFAGAHYTPRELAEQFGAPDEIEGLLYDPGEDGVGEPVYDTAEGTQYAVCHYLDFSFHLFVNPEDGQWTIEALELRNPLSPITMEGVNVGMELSEAVSSLQTGGYVQNMDIWNGRANLYFEKYDEQGYLCLVEIRLDEYGTIAYARGLWGAVAEMERADNMA